MVAMSTLWSSAIRAPMYALIRGSRISEAVSATESKYSSRRPLVNVPYIRGPRLNFEERTCRTCSSRRREIREPEDGPYTRRRRVRDEVDGEDTKNTALVREPDTFCMHGT